jgi:hypothetical protein
LGVVVISAGSLREALGGQAGYDVVCVRFGGGGWPNFSTVRAYAFSGGQLLTFTGHIVSSYGQGVLTGAVSCGSEPVFRPFPEWRT